MPYVCLLCLPPCHSQTPCILLFKSLSLPLPPCLPPHHFLYLLSLQKRERKEGSIGKEGGQGTGMGWSDRWINGRRKTIITRHGIRPFSSFMPQAQELPIPLRTQTSLTWPGTTTTCTRHMPQSSLPPPPPPSPHPSSSHTFPIHMQH